MKAQILPPGTFFRRLLVFGIFKPGIAVFHSAIPNSKKITVQPKNGQ
jgi:hypothetical protein